MKITGEWGDNIVLSSGRKEYANHGILGLTANEDSGDYVSYGYDGGFSTENWTQAERDELADTMILRWQKFKEWRK